MSNTNIRVFNATVIGESHIKNGKPCQDASLSFPQNIDDDSIRVAVVCDGHGGDRYIRSDKGSKFAAQVTVEAVREFLSALKENDCCPEVPEGDSFVQVPVKPENVEFYLEQKEEDLKAQKKKNADSPFWDIYPKIKKQEEAFRKLFVTIKERWIKCLEEDIAANPITETEKLYYEEGRLEQAYGTTLIAFIVTSECWFGFHIGDGSCVAFNKEGDWFLPILKDENCIGNFTTSLCNSNAIDNFRYSFGGKETIPVAVFLGSDGIDDSYVTTEKIAGFYGNVLRMFANEDFDKSVGEIESFLPNLSAKASRDDMSIAGILDLDKIKEVQPLLIEKELSSVEKTIEEFQKKEETIKETYQQKEEALNEEIQKKKDSQTDILDIAKQLEDLEQESEELQKEANFIKSQWEKLVNKKDYKTSEKDKLAEKRKEAESIINQVEKKIQVLEMDIKYAGGELSKYVSEKEQLEQKKERLSAELKKHQDK